MQNVQLANNRTNNADYNASNASRVNPGDTARISLSELRRRRRTRERKEFTFKVMVGLAVTVILVMVGLAGALILDAQSHKSVTTDGLRSVDMKYLLAETGGREFDAYYVDDAPIAKWRNGDYVIYCDLTNAEMHYYRSEPRLFGLLGEELTYVGGETNPDLGGELVAIQARDDRLAISTDCVNAMVRLNAKLAEEQA